MFDHGYPWLRRHLVNEGGRENVAGVAVAAVAVVASAAASAVVLLTTGPKTAPCQKARAREKGKATPSTKNPTTTTTTTAPRTTATTPSAAGKKNSKTQASCF